jgi:hypothetical protein
MHGMTSASLIAIRPATPDDAAAVERLAALDERPVPAGPLLLGVVDGEVSAAVAIRGGEAVADPFRPTAAVVDLLRHRARDLRAAA